MQINVNLLAISLLFSSYQSAQFLALLSGPTYQNKVLKSSVATSCIPLDKGISVSSVDLRTDNTIVTFYSENLCVKENVVDFVTTGFYRTDPSKVVKAISFSYYNNYCASSDNLSDNNEEDIASSTNVSSSTATATATSTLNSLTITESVSGNSTTSTTAGSASNTASFTGSFSGNSTTSTTAGSASNTASFTGSFFGNNTSPTTVGSASDLVSTTVTGSVTSLNSVSTLTFDEGSQTYPTHSNNNGNFTTATETSLNSGSTLASSNIYPTKSSDLPYVTFSTGSINSTSTDRVSSKSDSYTTVSDLLQIPDLFTPSNTYPVTKTSNSVATVTGSNSYSVTSVATSTTGSVPTPTATEVVVTNPTKELKYPTDDKLVKDIKFRLQVLKKQLQQEVEIQPDLPKIFNFTKPHFDSKNVEVFKPILKKCKKVVKV